MKKFSCLMAIVMAISLFSVTALADIPLTDQTPDNQSIELTANVAVSEAFTIMIPSGPVAMQMTSGEQLVGNVSCTDFQVNTGESIEVTAEQLSPFTHDNGTRVGFTVTTGSTYTFSEASGTAQPVKITLNSGELATALATSPGDYLGTLLFTVSLG